MKRERKNKNRILILLTAITLLFSARPLAGDGELYQARPENLPEWAKQGNFRFIRLDGGSIESRKAERTWWGKNFTDEEKDVLARIYDRDFDKILGLLKRAEFNWIWVTWSNGWSFEEESENRELIARVIESCHREGIRVTAYMSATNMFWLNTFTDDPETRRYGLYLYGLPLFYGGITKKSVSISFQRRLADVRKPGWRAYLLQKAQLAIDAGVDAIFFDNLIGDTDGLKLLVSEVQQMAEKKAAETKKPKVLVYANVHIAPYRFEINDLCELLWMEDGKDSPGVWDGVWQVENVRKIKFLNGEKKTWQPLMYENDVYHCGHRETCIPSPVVQKLSIAEAYAFGAAYSRNIEGRFLKGLIRDEKEAIEAWAAISHYNRFIAEHPGFYNRVAPVARIALMSKGVKNELADYFIRQNVCFETKVLDHLGKGEPLEKFRALVIPFRIGRLTGEQEIAIKNFVEGGGKVFCPDPAALARKLGSGDDASLVPIPENLVSRVKKGEPAGDFIEEVETAAQGPRLTIEHNNYLLANITKKVSHDSFIIHFINYNPHAPEEDVKVKLDLGDYLQDASGLEIKAYSPDQPRSEIRVMSAEGGAWEFTISRVKHYSVVVVSAGRDLKRG